MTKLNIKAEKKPVFTVKTNYPLGDFLIRIKNAALARKKVIEVSHSKLIYDVAKVLERMGYVRDVELESGLVRLNIVYRNKQPVVTDIILVSKPSRRIYLSCEKISSGKSPYLLILSTTQGVMSSKEAIRKNLGGEVLAKVL